MMTKTSLRGDILNLKESGEDEAKEPVRWEDHGAGREEGGPQPDDNGFQKEGEVPRFCRTEMIAKDGPSRLAVHRDLGGKV